MAKYDFDQLIPRRGTNSVKWDEEPAADILPMWVADMDFRTAPCVVEALRRRVEHGVYGYATVPESYYGAVTSWFARRHGWAPGADWILPVTGVIPALSAILRALTRPGDRVLVLTEDILRQSGDMEEARQRLAEALPQLQQTAAEEIAAQGSRYTVSARLEETEFPTREYDGFALPSGEYLALRVVIGEGAGKNWWLFSAMSRFIFSESICCFLLGKDSVNRGQKQILLVGVWII